MEGTSGRRDFVESDGGSDDETFENFGEHEGSEDGLLSCDSPVLNEELILREPTMEGLSMQNLEPFSGMTFPSLDDARNFYYEYAKRVGFTIRTNRIRHSLKNMAVIGRDFVCSREGFRAAKHTSRKDRVLPPRPITREGCKAMIRLAARDGNKWVVTKFVREHNHKLMTHCKFSGELPIINILSEAHYRWKDPLKSDHHCSSYNVCEGFLVRGGQPHEMMRCLNLRGDQHIVRELTPEYIMFSQEEKDKKIQDLYNELQLERERSAGFQQQLGMILKDLEEHADFMSVRVEDVVNKMREIELDDQ
ncbi:Protein FAR1-related sequence 5 [Vitis vinifera]|uniref:Protein FAR1-related sequence 5 n=1 Tax=Vitis vinifera TaxID=29760 RepID=A0A438I5D7_VITVI|nr:Protein FAR1-related sequence 5 [Vitis vinifera]